jgi:hypothetical protein
MAGYRRAHLSRPQAIPVSPLAFDPGPAAILLDGGLILGLENRLPWQSEAVAEISDVHPLLLREALSDLRTDAMKDSARIGERRVPSLARALETTEEES